MARKALYKHATQVNTNTYPDDGRARIDTIKTALMLSADEGEEMNHNLRSGYGGLDAKQWESEVAKLLEA